MSGWVVVELVSVVLQVISGVTVVVAGCFGVRWLVWRWRSWRGFARVRADHDRECGEAGEEW